MFSCSIIEVSSELTEKIGQATEKKANREANPGSLFM